MRGLLILFNAFTKRLALCSAEETDEAKLVRPLLELMAEQKLDFHGTFRVLTAFRPGMLPTNGDADSTSDSARSDLDKLVERLLAQAPDGGPKDRARATEEWHAWLDVYARRIEREAGEWAPGEGGEGIDVQRTRAGRAANPRFVLRQWLLQEVIAVVEKDTVRGRRVLAKVLHVRFSDMSTMLFCILIRSFQMACNPFEPWGGEDANANDEAQLDAEEREERRFCGLGDSRMLGFQCSCSS